MLGLKLRYQISGFLFILFTTVVLIMGYFNVTILNDQLRRFTLYQSEKNAKQIFSLIFETIPPGIDSIDTLADNNRFQELVKIFGTVESLRNISLYDKTGKIIYARRARSDVSVNNQAYLGKVAENRKNESVIWAIDPRSGKGEAVKSLGILDSRKLLNDYYYPIIRGGKFLGILRVSLELEKTSRLTSFFFIGNLSLSVIFILTAFIAIYVWSEHAINRPIRNLLRAQERLRRGDFDAHVELNVPSSNELNIISNSFNDMAKEIKRYQEQLTKQTTELELMNKQYRELNETLESEVKKKTIELREFFSLVTHDLKIPVAAIKGYTTLLKKEKTGQLNEKQERFVNSIETASNHLLGMVKNMLDSVKYEDGRIEYFMENFNLKELTREVESHFHPLLEEKEIELTKVIPEECAMVYGDRAKISQVISNILNNAINYTPQKGEIILTAADSGNQVEVRIRDSGAGIPEEQLVRIFDKFQQIPGKESPTTSLGLGLYIVRKIMEGHGQKVWAESTEGRGSSFYFTLEKAKNTKIKF